MNNAGFVSDSTIKRLLDLEKQVKILTNNLLFTPSVGVQQLLNGNLGSKNQNNGVTTGIEADQPITHYITDVDNSGVSTGIFDKINLLSANVVVDWVGHNAINLKYILKTKNNGQRISALTCAVGKTLKLQAGGNLDITSDINMTDKDIAYLVYSNDINAFRVLISTTSGGGGSNLWSAIIIDQDKNMLQKALQNLAYISFTNTGGVDQLIDGILGTGITYNVIVGEAHYFKIGNAEFMRISSATGILASTFLDLDGNAIQNTGSITPQLDKAELFGSPSLRYLTAYIEVLRFAVGREIDLDDTSHARIMYSVNAGESHQFQWGGVTNIVMTGTAIKPDDLIFSNGDATHRWSGLHTSSFTMYGSGQLSGAVGVAGWNSDFYPVTDGNNNLGTVTGGNARWSSLLLRGRVFFYDSASTTIYATIIKSASTHNLEFSITDATNPNPAFAFYVNGGQPLFEIVSGGQINCDLSVYPSQSVSFNLGSNALQWLDAHLGGSLYLNEDASTTKWGSITKDPTTHYLIYDFHDSVSGVGHLFTRNGNNSAFQFAIEDDGIFFGQTEHQAIVKTAISINADNNASVIFADATAGPITITLPAISSLYPGKHYYVIKVDSSGNAVTVARGSGSDSFVGTGTSSVTLGSQGSKNEFISNGTHTWAVF